MPVKNAHEVETGNGNMLPQTGIGTFSYPATTVARPHGVGLLPGAASRVLLVTRKRSVASKMWMACRLFVSGAAMAATAARCGRTQICVQDRAPEFA